MSFIRGTEYANKLNSWHNNLEEDRQQRASLRRCSSLLDVYTSSGFRDLLFKRQLPAFFYSLPRGSLKTATVA